MQCWPNLGKQSNCLSITGGVVYYGKAIASLRGKYIYSDWGFGNIWALGYDSNKKKVTDNVVVWTRPESPKGKPRIQPAAIVLDGNGELLILDWNHRVYEVVGK